MSPRARTAPGSAGGLLARALTATTVATLLGVLLGILPAVMAPAAVAATTTAPVAVTMNVGLAPWWNGDCDATRWGPIAASYGWKGVGSHRLGASYLGVPVCGPRPSVDGSPNVLWGRAGWGEAEWQCVELAQRFMAQVYGTKAFQANGSEVVAHYTTAMGGGLVKIANGTVGVAPVPGDIISFTTPKNPYGHVVVVTASSVDSNGNGSITVLSQNDTADGWRTLAVTAWKVATINTLTPYGWLHDPLGRGNPLGDGQFVQASDNSALYEIVGGAPLAVPAGTLPATTRVTRVDRPQISRLLAFPRNGTVIKDTTSGSVYRFAGGAPMLVDPSDAAKLPLWGVQPPIAVGSAALQDRAHVRSFPADGTRVCRVDDNSCYVVAGGAPLLVSAAEQKTLPGWATASPVKVSSGEFTAWAHLRPTPQDGTFVCDSTTPNCYVTAGGAPLLMGAKDPGVPGYTTTSAVIAPHGEFVSHRHLAARPADGTVLCPVADAHCYVVAGGAPIAIASKSSPAVPIASAVTITRTELLTPTHLRATPVDGTLLQSAQTKQAYVVQSGVALPAQPQNNPTAASVVAVTIDQSALDNAGTAPAFNHLVSAPARVMLDGGFRTVTTASATTLSWSAPIASSAVTSYDVRIRRATPTSTWGPWTSVASLSGISTTSARIGIPAGATACVSVRAHNRAGQVGPWSSVHCTVRMADDRIATTLSAGWRLTSDPKAFAGTLTRTTTHAATWHLDRVTARRVSVVATTCATCGSIVVTLGTTRLGTISLTSSTTTYGVQFDLPAVPITSGSLTIAVTSPAGRLVALDAVLVSPV